MIRGTRPCVAGCGGPGPAAGALAGMSGQRTHLVPWQDRWPGGESLTPVSACRGPLLNAEQHRAPPDTAAVENPRPGARAVHAAAHHGTVVRGL